MTKRIDRPWLNYLLGAFVLAAILIAYRSVGAASSQTASSSRYVTVATGVVQSTVSGSGHLQAASELNLGFKTAGTVTAVYVHQGQHVAGGQLIAALDPRSAEVTLEQAKATLQSAEATLTQEEEQEGETTGTSAGGSTTSKTTATTAAATDSAEHSVPATAASAVTPSTASPAAEGQGATSPTATRTATTTAPTTAPTTTTRTAPSTSTTTTTTTAPTTTAPTTTTRTAPSTSTTTTTPSKATSTTATPASGSETTKQSAAVREANLASARAAVKSDKLASRNDEQALANTRLIAPRGGTIVSVKGEVGQTVTGGGTSRVSTSGSSSGGSSTGTAGAGAGGGAGAGTSSSTSTSSGSSESSGSTVAVLSDLEAIELVVPLSESEVGNVHVGQTATVTVEALGGRKVAAHVTKVDTQSTTNSGVVSYNVTFELDQALGGVKPGMSASAAVVVRQAEGLNVPSTSITGGTVTMLRNGRQVRQAVETGLAGDSTTIILGGLKAGEQVVLPVTSSSSATSITSKLGGRGGGGLGGGGFGGGPPGGGPPGGG